MRREWEPEDLISSWTLEDDDWDLISNKTGATRLGFAVLLKFFVLEARFPRHPGEIPVDAVGYVAGQVKVPAEAFSEYEWSGRTIEYHRAQVRSALGFREATRDDEARLVTWLADEVCPVELGDEQLRRALLARCRAEHVEPPGRSERVLGAARTAFDQRFCETTAARLSDDTVRLLEDLIVDDTDGDSGRGLLVELKADPRQLGLETLVNEVEKLQRVRSFVLPPDLFEGTSERVVAAWRARAATL